MNGTTVVYANGGAKVDTEACGDEISQKENGDTSLALPGRRTDPLEKRRMEKMLIARMLDLDEPRMTEKMISFLSSDGACESYISFITQIPEGDEVLKSPAKESDQVCNRPEPGDEVSEELKRSFRATMLLANTDPSDSHRDFVSKKARVITKALLKVFWPTAKGSLHHACCVLDYLLRAHTDELFETLGRNGESLERHLGPMLRCAEYPPVSDTIVKLLTFQTVSSVSYAGSNYQATLQTTTTTSKWRLYSGLAEWRFLLRVAEKIFDRNSSDSYASACADLLLEMVDRLSSDDNGELLLQPIGYCKELVDGLAGMALDQDLSLERRTDNARALHGITQKAAQENIVSVNARTSIFDPQPTTTVAPNRLSSVRDLLYENLQTWLPRFCTAVTHMDDHGSGLVSAGTEEGTTEPVAHPGYEVKRPFTMLRYILVGVIVEVTNRDPKQFDVLPVELWKVLCTWFFRYPHNNLYHSIFYKLVFKILRSNNVGALKMAVSKARLVAHLVDSHLEGDKTAGNRGYVLQLCNAIRLQADTLPPTDFLRNYLSSHEQWRKFLGTLREVTLKQQTPGLGFELPEEPRYLTDGSGLSRFNQLGAFGLQDGGIDHGSAYARALGFENDVAWLPDDESCAQKSKKKKKRKKKKKKKRETEEEQEQIATDDDDAWDEVGQGDQGGQVGDGDEEDEEEAGDEEDCDCDIDESVSECRDSGAGPPEG